MITIFASPKPFIGHIGIIQENAIRSWMKLLPECEIILFGNTEGTSEIAKKFGIKHISKVSKSRFGTIQLDEAFAKTKLVAKNNIIAYVNCDIILLGDFIESVSSVLRAGLKDFLIAGRRWDLDIKKSINFNSSIWEKDLKKLTVEKGKLHGYSGMDYFVFLKKIDFKLPSFSVGRPAWDNWLLHHFISRKIPVINATSSITAIHQNHLSNWNYNMQESKDNLKLAGSFYNLDSLRHSTFVLENGVVKRSKFYKAIYAKILSLKIFRTLFLIKNKIINLFVK